MNYYVYILRSLKDGSFYIGYTSDLHGRLEKHNRPHKGYTSSKKPWEIAFYEVYTNKSEALKREKFLKKQKSSAFYRKLIEQGKQGGASPPSSGSSVG